VLRKGEAMGGGDPPLLAMIGATLGWKALLPVVLLSSLQGSVIGVLLILLGRAETGEPKVKPALEGGTPPSPDSAGTSSAPVAPGPGATPSDSPSGAAGANADAEGADEEEEWVPPARSVPFGPFLALGAIEQLFLGDWLRLQYEAILRHLM